MRNRNPAHRALLALGCLACVALVGAAPPAPVAARQTGPAPAESTQSPEDYRGRVYTACSLVFAAIIVFLILSHRRNAALGEEVKHLERRLGDLES